MCCDSRIALLRDLAMIALMVALILLIGFICEAVIAVRIATVDTLREFSTAPARVQAELSEANGNILKANGQWLALADAVSKRSVNQVTSEIRESRIETLAALDSRLGQAIASTSAEIRLTREMLDVHLAETTRDVAKTSETIAGFREDVQPLVANAEWWTRRNTVAPQVLGVLGATKVTMGQVAQMSKTINDATPQYVQSTQGIAKSLDERLKPKWYDRILSATATGALIWSTTK